MNYPYNPYMPMMQQQSMPIQSIQQIQKTAQFYTVDNIQELDSIRPNLNVMYIGMNKKKKEIYVKQLTNDGLVSIETYGLATDKKEKSEFETILEKIKNIETKLGGTNVANNTADGTTGNANVVNG